MAKKDNDRYWEVFADGLEFANQLWSNTCCDEEILHPLLDHHAERLRQKEK